MCEDVSTFPVKLDTDVCSHSHLPIHLLKKIGKAVEKVGSTVVETALTVVLSNLGAFGDEDQSVHKMNEFKNQIGHGLTEVQDL